MGPVSYTHLDVYKRQMDRRVCLITGASAGIGKEFAQLMAQRGYDLILTARREERLIEIANNIEKEWGAKSLIIVEDLAKDGAVDRIISKINANKIKVDALINLSLIHI